MDASDARYVSLIVLLGAVGVAPAFADAAVEVGFDVRFSGVITTVGAAGETWVIGGQTVATDAATNVVLTVSPATPGQWAEVAAAKLDDGSLLAKQITVRPEQVRLRGIVTDIPETITGAWVIAGVTVNVTEDTRISERSGKVVEGQWVEAVMTEDKGVLTATHIVGIGDQDAVMVSGEIQQFNDTEWVISGIPLSITPDTLISGTPVVGLIGPAADLRMMARSSRKSCGWPGSIAPCRRYLCRRNRALLLWGCAASGRSMVKR